MQILRILFSEKRVFSRYEAAIWLQENCPVQFTLATLQIAWGWGNRMRVKRFLDMLCKEGFICIDGQTISIVVAQQAPEEPMQPEQKEPETFIIPTIEVVEQERPEGVPPTYQQLKKELEATGGELDRKKIVVDLKQINANDPKTPPALRLYKRYAEQFPYYAIEEGDLEHCRFIIEKIQKTASSLGERSGQRYHKNLLPELIDRFVENIAKTFYAGKGLSTINNSYNNVVSSIVQHKKQS